MFRNPWVHGIVPSKEISTQLLTADINIKKQLLFMVTIVAEYDGSRGAYPVIEHKCLMGFL